MSALTLMLALLASPSLKFEQDASAQCTMGGPPQQFAPSGNPLGYGPNDKFKGGFSTDFELYNQGGRRLILRENFGLTTYSLDNPGAPSMLAFQDIEGQTGYEKAGDGFNTVVAVAAAPDGSRALVNYKQTPHGNLVMRPNGNVFTFAGEFAPTQTQGGVAVDQYPPTSPNRYLGYALKSPPSNPALSVADITAMVSGANATKANSIPAEQVSGTPPGYYLTRAGHFIVYSTGAAIIVVDARSPGPIGAVSSPMTFSSFGPAAFGLPAADRIYNFAAGIHPADGKLYIMAETTLSDSTSSGFALASTSDGVNLTPVGNKFLAPLLWAGGTSTSASTMVATTDDLLIYSWTRKANSAGLQENKLFTWSASNWGTDLTPSTSFPATDNFPSVVFMRGFFQGSGQVYTYLATQQAAYALSMSCSGSLSSPATADVIVQTDPPIGPSLTLANGATVFVGDKLKISPSISPSPSSQPLTDFRFDYDFHASEDTGSGYPRIRTPDIGPSVPTTLSLVGPCDPNGSNANPANGVGCWASVVANNDFVAAPAVGSSTPLRIALEARNANGSAGLKTFTLNFKVPTIRLKSTSILLGNPVSDGSEGSPQADVTASRVFKWYFGSDPAAPVGETLTQDSACSGAVCNHSFAGKGSYNYWLTVPYANGYVSADCAAPCNQSLGKVAVTDVVLAFTSVPTLVQKSNPTFSFSSQSTKSASVVDCGAGLEYNICDATAGPCAAGAYSPLTLTNFASGTATLPTPGNAGNYYLRIRYNFTTSVTCGVENWNPNVVGVADKTAWPFAVSNVTPQIRIGINGATPIICGQGAGGGGSACQVYVNDSLTAYAYVLGVQDTGGTQNWSAPNASPSSGSGQGFSFSYASASSTTRTLTLSGYGGTVSQGIDVSTVPVVVNPLTVSGYSTPANPNPGQNVTFNASASGGTGTATFRWDFGDGGSATGASAIHSYANAGSYTATVTATAGSATASAGVYVNVVAPGGGGGGGGGSTPISFSINDDATGIPVSYSNGFGYNVTSGQRLKFISINATGSISWDFGDGTSSTDPGPVKTYTTLTTKVYTCKLTANGQTRSNSVEVAGGAGAALTGAYTFRYADGTIVNQANVTPGKAIRFTASDSADTYLWDFGDGSALGNSSPVDHSFGGSGTFVVSLSVSKSGLAPATTASPSSFVIPPPPEPDQWLIPGMAYTDGLGGASWQSDLSIYNPNAAQPMTVSLAFLDGQSSISDANQLRWNQIILNKGQTVPLVNVLKNAPFFLPKGKYGAILIRGDVLPSQPIFSSRTYNQGSSTGTFGLSMPAAPVAGGVRLGPQAPAAVAGSRLIGLRENEGSYTNFGMANLKPDYAKAEVRFYDAGGQQIGQVVTFELAPYGVAQYNHVLSNDPPLGAGYKQPILSFSAAVKVTSGTAVSPYATVIDSISKDPIFITPPARPSASYRLPGIIRAQGQNNTLWRSDVVLYNPSATERKINVNYSFLSDGGLAARSSVSNILTIKPNEILEGDDFVKLWLNLSSDNKTNFSSSWVDVSPQDSNTDPLLVLGHTYNNQPTGNVGLQIPGFTTDDGVTSSGAKKRLLMTGINSSTTYRSNIAFFLVSQAAGGSAQANLKILDATGALVKTVPIALDAFNAFVQKNDGELFADIAGDKSNLTIVLDNVAGASPIAGYATVIDQISGDAILIPAQPAP